MLSPIVRDVQRQRCSKRGSGDGQRLSLYDYGATERSFHAVERWGSTLTCTVCTAADSEERQICTTCLFAESVGLLKRRRSYLYVCFLMYAFSHRDRGAHFCLRGGWGKRGDLTWHPTVKHQRPAAKTTNSNCCDRAAAQVKWHIPEQPGWKNSKYSEQISKTGIKLILKTIGNRKGDCAWSCSRWQTQPEKICKLQSTNQYNVRSEWHWFVRCDLQIFWGCVCHLEQLHAQSPFLFPIVFSIIIGSAEALPILCVRYFRWERERERYRERERERRKWRHHCRAKIGDEHTFTCQKFAQLAMSLHFPLPKFRTFRFSLHTSRLSLHREVTIVALKFAMSSHFPLPKIFPPSLLPHFQMARAARRVIENPRQKIKSCPVLFCSSHRKTESN